MHLGTHHAPAPYLQNKSTHGEEVKSSVEWVFDFCNDCQFWVFEKNQNQRTTGSGYLKTLKELPGYMKEPVNTWQFSRQLFDFVQKIENNSYK
jgi:hypothetical protein